jgi:MoaA/NifB/PqqE/SkfB family radical SAM enzyme
MTSKTICAYPWVHMSAHLDGEMIICCNTYEKGNIKQGNGTPWKLKDIKDPLVYFNSNEYKKIRLDMLNGEEPEICKKCYDIERNGGHSIRQNTLSEYNIEELVLKTDINTGELQELTLDYVHFMWGNKCNLKCKMCGPDSSNQLIDEFRAMGMNVADNVDGINLEWSFEYNRAVLEKIAPYIKILNVTGGEPLINNDFLDYCKYLSEHGYSKNIRLAFHTNLTVMPGKFVDTWKDFKWVNAKLSIDAIEQDYEYIRYPGKWNIVSQNIQDLISITDSMPHVNVEVHTVFSSFNAHALPNLLNYLTAIKHPRFINFPNTLWVTWPRYADSRCLPVEIKQKVTEECLAIIEKYSDEKSHQVTNNISNLVSNLKTMNESNRDQTEFIKFNKMQDQYRSVKTENIINWYNL